MKKLFLMLTACCMMFVACNNQKTEEVANEEKAQCEQTECQKKDCCKEMMEKWANFDNLTAEEQASLIEKKGGCITKVLAEVDLEKVECPNAKQAIQEFQTKWEGFAAADQAGKKALIDEFDNAHWKHAVMPEKCCKAEKEGCCDKDCCKDCKCCKDGCKDCKCCKDGKCCKEGNCCKDGKCCKDNGCKDCTCKEGCCKDGQKDCKK